MKNFDDYLLEEIKDDPELAKAYAKASAETKEYVAVIDRQRQLIKELIEDGNWWNDYDGELDADNGYAELHKHDDNHRSLMARLKEAGYE